MKSTDKLSVILQAARTLINDYTDEPTTALSMFNTLHASESNCTLALTTLERQEILPQQQEKFIVSRGGIIDAETDEE